MKKSVLFLLFICTCIFGMITSCNKQSAPAQTSEGIVSQFLSGDVMITISRGAPLLTKGESNVSDLYTVTGELNSIKYSLLVENIENDGLLFRKVYSQEGTWLFSEVSFNGELIRTEFASLDDSLDDAVSTKGARHHGEKYGECVRRVHKDLKEATEEHNPITCEFVPCGAIAAVVAVIDCGQYE